MNIGSLIAHGLNGYDSQLPAGSTISATTGTPLPKMLIEGPERVVGGRYQMAIISPSWYLRLARDGKGPFPAPLPVCAIAVFPHDDRLVFAVRKETNITSLRAIKEDRVPLKVSLPAPDHSSGWMIDQVFAQYGFSRDDIEDWGGRTLNDRPASMNSPDVIPVDPSFDAVFDEAIMTLRWKRISEGFDLYFLSVDEEVLARCREMGMVPGILEKGRLRGVEADVPTIDASGWALYCAEDMSYDLAYLTARAIDKQKEAISARFTGPTAGMTKPINDMRSVCRDLPVPLHPGAEAYYREQGYLG